MLSLLAPGALLALTALAVPLLLHLRRRSEQKLVRFAALRWLGQGARPRSQVRLEQRLLLATRLLLLAALVFLLAGPVWRSAATASQPWVVVTPGVDPAAARAAVEGSPTEWRWLAPTFPGLDRATPAPAGADFSSLLRQLDAEMPPGAALQVVVPQELSGLDAERLQLHRAVEWRVVAGNTPAPAMPAHTGNDLQLALRYDAQHTAGLPLVHALAAAWHAAGLDVTVDEAQSDTPPAAGVDALFWLGADLPEPLRQWVRTGGTLVAADPAAPEPVPGSSDVDAGLPTPIALGQGRLLLFSAALDPTRNAALRNPELPTRLLALLRHDAAPPDRAPAASVSPLRAADAAPNTAATTPLDIWLALLAALLFLAERILSLRAARQRP
ncbi:BatA domain-containing protein [Nevskia soli]|uniref:BatA domain-containing protein n=1 Tax=Nevskia soli TaxID=418856 RepID=UPI0004A73F0B|nr:BatA domain-containing protein [Nevskia soli]